MVALESRKPILAPRGTVRVQREKNSRVVLVIASQGVQCYGRTGYPSVVTLLKECGLKRNSLTTDADDAL